jgi:hypothetical protein
MSIRDERCEKAHTSDSFLMAWHRSLVLRVSKPNTLIHSHTSPLLPPLFYRVVSLSLPLCRPLRSRSRGRFATSIRSILGLIRRCCSGGVCGIGVAGGFFALFDRSLEVLEIGCAERDGGGIRADHIGYVCVVVIVCNRELRLIEEGGRKQIVASCGEHY